MQLQQEIIKNYENNSTHPEHGALCKPDIDLLNQWKWDTNATGKSEFLTKQGWQDLKLLAKSYQSKFPDVLQRKYTPENFLVSLQ
jgi:hypothetical protein